jgi:hypothetical protein
MHIALSTQVLNNLSTKEEFMASALDSFTVHTYSYWYTQLLALGTFPS